jgi:nucleoside-diphosphate-sugar epimerase
MKGKITIVGCGWLGMPLVNQLVHNFEVHVLTRSKAKIEALRSIDIHAIPFLDSTAHLSNEIIQTDWLIYMIPPSGMDDYVAFTKNILHQFPVTTKIIFTSSIGVYEPSLEVINEQSKVIQNHPLVLVETYIQQTFAQSYSLRLAGLINEQRHPVYYLSGKENLNPMQVVNLVHQTDVITAIQSILAEQPLEHTFNICYPAHPSRQEYYTQQAQKLNLPLPIFINQNELGKQIDGNQIEQMTSFRYRTSIFNKK